MNRDSLSLIGRICIAVIFLLSGINKIANPEGTQQYMAAMGMTTGTTLLYVGAIIIEIGAGLSVLLGYWTTWGAALLFLFMIPTTLVFHTNFGDQNQMIHFMKNVAMMGGLLYVAAYGAGRFSLDAQWGRSAEPWTAAGTGTVADRRRMTGSD